MYIILRRMADNLFAFSSNPALSLLSQSREIVVLVITHNFKEFAGNYPNIRTNLG
jgi:hypothetical protein